MDVADSRRDRQTLRRGITADEFEPQLKGAQGKHDARTWALASGIPIPTEVEREHRMPSIHEPMLTQ